MFLTSAAFLYDAAFAHTMTRGLVLATLGLSIDEGHGDSARTTVPDQKYLIPSYGNDAAN
jgi:hypothetical protein